MREIAEDLAGWQAAGTRFAIATVVRTWHSAPRRPGAAMAVAETGEVVGSVSGGCVEGAVYELAQEVLDTGRSLTRTYGVSDGDALTVGLTCGGIIEVLVQPGDFPQLPAVLERIARHEPVAIAATLNGECGRRMAVATDTARGTLGDPALDARVADLARGLLAHGRTEVVHLGPQGQHGRDEQAVFVQSFAPPPRMLVLGAIDFAAALARIGRFLGYHVTVCDARAVFATRRRFPDVDDLVVMWPHQYLDRTTVDERTVICVLTHDPKFDVPALTRALAGPAGYVGALGSRRTHEDRLRRLREAGVPADALARLRSPIGLDLGGRTPEETAVAIAAEIVALRCGGTGAPLSDTERAIHH